MTKKIYLETFKKCAGSLCFTLLIIFKIFKNVSDWFIFPNPYLHYIKYRNLILFPGDEIFSKRSVVRDNSSDVNFGSSCFKVFLNGCFCKWFLHVSILLHEE